MAEKSAKKKPKKAVKANADASVLGSLPATRPNRIGGERRASAGSATKAAAPKATAAKTAAPKARPATPKPKRTTAASAAAEQTAAARPEAPPRVPPPVDDGRRPSGPPRGTEIVTTAVQAAGELAQIGLVVGGQLIKRAAGRLPRP